MKTLGYYTVKQNSELRSQEALGLFFWITRKSLVNVVTKLFQWAVDQETLNSRMLNHALSLKDYDVYETSSKHSRNTLIMRQMYKTTPYNMMTAWLQYAFNDHNWSAIDIPLVQTDGISEHVEDIIKEMLDACKTFTLERERNIAITFILTPPQTPTVEKLCKGLNYLGVWNGTEFITEEA